MRAELKGFKEYNRKSWWYGGRLTKSNFDEVAAFIKRCTAGTFVIDKEAGTIVYTNRFQATTNTAKVGMYVVRNVGGDYGEVLALTPRQFKEQYAERRNYALLKYYDLTPVEYDVLRSFHENDTDMFYSYDWIMDYTKVDRKTTKVAVDKLRTLGVVTFLNGLMNDDGEVCGSGFGLYDTTQVLMSELLMTRYEVRHNIKEGSNA